MDKYEYKLRTDEITALVEEKNYKRAAEIADTIDWRRVRSVMMLCTISDVYKMVRRFEDSRALLLLAYEKRPGSRMIVYALTELSIKLNDVVHAWEFYKEFCQLAPTDSRQYILLYKIYAAQDVSLEEQISVLETLKEKEYDPRWAYELAYLYHRIGFATKCVEECDEIILWFGEGKYVKKAMELKMLHEPLTPKQQAKYDGESKIEAEFGDTKVIPNLDAAMTKEVTEAEPTAAPTIEFPAKDVEEIRVKTIDPENKYNTVDMQKDLAASLAEIMANPAAEGALLPEETEDFDADMAQVSEDEWQSVEISDTGEIPNQMEEVFFEDPATADLSDAIHQINTPDIDIDSDEPIVVVAEPKVEKAEPKVEKASAATKAEKIVEDLGDAVATTSDVAGISKVIVPKDPSKGVLKYTQMAAEFAEQKTEFDDMLAQDTSGQISMVMPEEKVVEKQITGQLSISDILNEWERIKQEKENNLKESVKQRVLEQTGDLFAEFDEQTRESILEQMQRESEKAEDREREKAEAEEAELAQEEAEEVEDAPAKEEQKVAAAEKTKAPVQERALTQEEKELFDSFIQSKRTRMQLAHALDMVSLAAYTGNILLTGERDAGTLDFAKNMVKHLKETEPNFTGNSAKIAGEALNKKDISAILDKVKNGALIVENAGAMSCQTSENLVKGLQNEERGVLVILVDTKNAMESLLAVNECLKDPFDARVDIEALNDNKLVEYGKRYAYEKEYAIDDMGALALHTRIADMQTLDHAVTVGEVRQIIKEAIAHSNRKTMAHFWDVLFGRRYDEEDMIVLRESDFLLS